MTRTPQLSSQAIIAEVNRTGSLVLRGTAALRAVRHAIDILDETTNLLLEFDPASEPELRDYLAVAGLSAAKGALVGSAIGLLVGLAIDRPALATTLGVGVGALIGASNGITRVDVGWRLKAWRLSDGVPQIEIARI